MAALLRREQSLQGRAEGKSALAAFPAEFGAAPSLGAGVERSELREWEREEENPGNWELCSHPTPPDKTLASPALFLSLGFNKILEDVFLMFFLPQGFSSPSHPAGFPARKIPYGAGWRMGQELQQPRGER